MDGYWDRPAAVTWIAALAGFCGAALLGLSISLVCQSFKPSGNWFQFVAIFIAFAIAIFPSIFGTAAIWLALGLWRRRERARTGMRALCGCAMGFALLTLFIGSAGAFAPRPNPQAMIPIPVGLVCFAIAYWVFWKLGTEDILAWFARPDMYFDDCND